MYPAVMCPESDIAASPSPVWVPTPALLFLSASWMKHSDQVNQSRAVVTVGVFKLEER